MPSRSSKRDFSQVAFDIVRKVTEQIEPAPSPEVSAVLNDEEKRKELMREMGRRGGQKGGIARAKQLTAEERTARARRAAEKRWSRDNDV